MKMIKKGQHNKVHNANKCEELWKTDEKMCQLFMDLFSPVQ